MPSSLLLSKFHQPAIPQKHVPRPHLVERLAVGLAQGRSLALISAPAGYGKSTLVVEWLAGARLPAAWLVLDEADDEPVRFFLYLLEALRQVKAGFGAQLYAALEAGQMPAADVLITGMVNEMLDWEQRVVLVLDDFQWIQHADILEILRRLLAHQPDRLLMVIVTREDPALPVARMRSRGQLTEIRAADLRFSDAESERFLRAGLGLELTSQDVARLTERTEGWVAGLQLAGLSLQGRENPAALVDSISGSHRYIMDYLVEEVLHSLPEDMQDFLLSTSILPRLCGDLCAAVTGISDSAARLEALQAANLFLLPLDDERKWFRYHHLFADLLHNRLQRARPEQIAGLHLRASAWFEENGQWIEAVDHAMAGEDFSRAAALLETLAWDLLNQGYTRKVEHWLENLPQQYRGQSARTSLSFAWVHLLRGNFGLSGQYLSQVFAALSAQPDPRVEAEACTLRANLLQSQGRAGEALEAAEKALRLAEVDNHWVRGAAYLAQGAALRQMGQTKAAAAALRQAIQFSRPNDDIVTEMLAVSHLTMMALHFGGLQSAAETAADSIAWMERHHVVPPPMAGSVFGSVGLIYYEWNQLEMAREYFLRGEQLSTFSGHNASLMYTRVGLAQVSQAEGQTEAALRVLEEAEELLNAGSPGWTRPDFILRKVHVLLSPAVNDWASAERVLRESGVRPGEADQTAVSYQTERVHLAWLRWMLAQRDPAALDQARRIVAAADAGERTWALVQALILGALAAALLPSSGTVEEEPGAADWEEWLLRALELGEREGYQRIFLDEGPPLAELLSQINPGERLRAYWSGLLEAFGRSAAAAARPPAGAQGALVEPLTERELEVVRLLAEGLTYAQMAERLVVSINTVRYHVKEIYGKLGVTRQVQALERVRELGLL